MKKSTHDIDAHFLYVSGRLEIEDELYKIRLGRRDVTFLADGTW